MSLSSSWRCVLDMRMLFLVIQRCLNGWYIFNETGRQTGSTARGQNQSSIAWFVIQILACSFYMLLHWGDNNGTVPPPYRTKPFIGIKVSEIRHCQKSQKNLNTLKLISNRSKLPEKKSEDDTHFSVGCPHWGLNRWSSDYISPFTSPALYQSDIQLLMFKPRIYIGHSRNI